MHRPAVQLRNDPAARLAELERRHPEWERWLRLLGEIRRALDDPAEGALLGAEPLADPAEISEKRAPLLHRRTLRVDPDRLRRLVRRLVSVASTGRRGAVSLRGYAPSAADAVALVEAAVRLDPVLIAQAADAAGVGRPELSSVAHAAAIPLLHACRLLLDSRGLPRWNQGYCPICGAWPLLAERRGLDRSRRLRCGRCAADWEVAWLYCVYCGERDHERLGSLVPGSETDVFRVETCDTCRRYLKSIATLQGLSAFELLLRDVETVELDLAALERGFGRPAERAIPLEVRLA